MRCKSERPMVKHKKGLWSPDEDKKLTYYVMNYGHSCWTSVPINAGLQRNGKSCRLRWINYLRPGLKRGAFSLQEEETILTLHSLLGNKWSQISQHLPGRTDNEIKNYWHSLLKKRIAKVDHHQLSVNTEPSSSCINTSNFTDSLAADMDQLVPPVTRISSLPKLLFADWISLDEFQHDEFGKLSDQPYDGPNYQWNTTEHEWQCNEGSTESSETQNCAKSGSINEDMFHTHMTIDQVFELNDVDFDIDDFMYM